MVILSQPMSSKEGKPLELALLSRTGSRFVPMLILALDNGVLFRLGNRCSLALGGGFGSRLAAMASGFVGIVLGRRFRRGALLAGFQSVKMLFHSCTAVAYTSSDKFV